MPVARPLELWPARVQEMADIIELRARIERRDQEDAVDLLTAVDAAIRDLRDILQRWGEDASRLQADECRRMLERAFAAAL
jgi:hypothetical protein